ncbi:MAG TPA: RNA polymerase sigma factor [Bacteroidales bacterium]|nr:RNA polymerase sigma factor [Bacteroidales bacterium]
MKTKEYNIIVDKHADGLYRFILGNIKDEFKAQDIVQDSFERLWINHDTVEFDKAKSFLFRIAYNRMIDVIRHEKRINIHSEIYNKSEDITDYRQAELREVINNAMAKLSEVQRSVVLLRDYEGYSYEEIAQITDLNEAQVKVYIFRARQHLKSLIGNFEEVIK